MFYFQKSEKIKCCHYNFTGVFYLHRRIQPIDIQRIQKYVTNSGMILPIQFFEKSQNFEKAPKQLFSVTKKCVFVLRKLLSFAFIFCSPYLIFLNHTLQYGIAVVRRFFEMGPKSVLRRLKRRLFYTVLADMWATLKNPRRLLHRLSDEMSATF